MTDPEREQWFADRLAVFAREAQAAGFGDDDQESVERIACAFLASGVRLLVMTNGTSHSILSTVRDLIEQSRSLVGNA